MTSVRPRCDIIHNWVPSKLTKWCLFFSKCLKGLNPTSCLSTSELKLLSYVWRGKVTLVRVSGVS
jgi:hypothetical protein